MFGATGESMITKPQLTILLAVLCLASATAHAKELIREFKGSRSTSTVEFEARAPWILDWRVTGDFSDVMGVEVSLVNANTGAHLGHVLKTKYAGNGVRMFEESGSFYFRIDSTLANWTLRVEQLSREEAELYTPKTDDLIPDL